MEKELQVVMLPTEKASEGQLFVWNDTGNESVHIYSDMGATQFNNGSDLTIAQHLYLVSDEEIKEGDWYYVKNIRVNEVRKALVDKPIYSNGMFKKVIATTDTSLKTCQCKKVDYHKMSCKIKYQLPQIPQSFIEEFVKANGKIDKVMVHYNAVQAMCQHGDTYVQKSIKLTDNNEVIIIPPVTSEKTYTREEVAKLLWDIRNFYHETRDYPFRMVRAPFKIWIDENLK